LPENPIIDWKKDSQSFDTVADLYHHYRPGYPQELIDCIIELTGLPPAGKILEIGSGTGKATLLFAQRGYSILCVEPGENLAAVAARNLGTFPGVQFEISRFEDWQEKPDGFDLVLSAQAFHWVPKEVGYTKATRALKPHGHLALFWNMYPGFEGQIAADLDRVYQEIAPGLGSPFNATDEVVQQLVHEIDESGCFGPVTVRRFPWSMRYSTKQYRGLLNTYSDHLRLPEQTRERLFSSIGDVIEKHGGSVVRPYIAVLYIAEKVS
jgi:SAM-dependent methyltransferase